MARNVGSIEVTVDADTGKLKAQLVKDGTAAGKDAKKAIERQLRDIDASIDLNTTKARAELKKFQTAIDAVDGDIEIGIDEAALRVELERIKAEIASLDRSINLDFDDSFLKEKLKNNEDALRQLQTLAENQPRDVNVKNSLQANIDRIKAENEEILLRLDADPKLLEAKIKALQEQQHDIEFTLEFAPQARALLEAQLKRIETEKRTVNMVADLDEKRVLAQLEELQKDQQIQLELDPTEATAEFEAWKRRLELARVNVPIDGDLTDFNLAIRELRAKLALEKFDIKAHVEPEVDQTAIAKAKAQMQVAGRGAGESFFEGFGSGGQGIIPNEIEKWFPLIGLALQPLGPLIQGVVGTATQLAGSALSAIGGAAGAAAPLVAGLAASLGAVVIASLGVGKGISAVVKEFGAASEEGRAFNMQAKAIQKALGPLGPAARDVVEQFAKLFPQLQAFQNIIAEQVFAGLGTEIARLSRETIPDLAASLSLAGQSANRFFHELSASVQGIDFTGTFLAVQPAVDSMGRAIATVVRAIEPFLKAAAPAARELATWIEQGASSFTKMVQAGAGSGRITSFLLDGVSSLKEWVRLAGSLGTLLFHVFDAGKSGGDGMIRSLTTLVNKWDDWVTSIRGQDALGDFFANSRQIMADLVPLLSGLANGLKAIFTASSGDSFRTLAADLGRVVEVMGELLAIMSRANITGSFVALLRTIADALEPIIPDLQAMATAIGGALASAIRGVEPAIQGLAQIIGLLARAFSDLPSGIQEVVVVLGLLATAASKIGFDKLTSGFASVRDNITLLKPALQDVGSAFRTFGEGFKTFDPSKMGQGLSQLGPALAQAGKSAAAAAGTAIAGALGIAFGAQMVAESHDMTQQVMGVMTIIGSSVAAFAAGGPIVGGITLALGAVTALFQASQRDAQKAKAEINEYVEALGGIGPAADKAKAVQEVMTNLADESQDVKDTFDELGIAVGEWARGLVEGTDDAASGMAEVASKFGSAGKEIAQGLLTGKINVDDFARAMDLGIEEVNGIDLRAFRQAMYDAGIGMETQGDMFGFLRDEASEYDSATGELAQKQRLLGDGLKGLTGDSDAAANSLNTNTESTDQNAAAAVAASEAQAALSQQMQNTAGTAKASADGFSSISDAVFGIAGPMSATEAAMAGVGKAAADAAKQAEAMGKAIDALISPALDSEAALSDQREAVRKLGESLADNGTSLDINTEKGANNRAAIRDSIQAILDYGQAAINSGDSADHVSQSMEDMRNELIQQVAAFTGSTASAEDYVNQLHLTPDSIETIVKTPGLLEASKSILDYDFDLDGIPDSQDTEFSASNLDVVKAHLAEYGIDLSQVPDSVLTEYLSHNWQQIHDQAQQTKADADAITNTPAQMTISETGATETEAAADNVFQKIGSLDTLTGTATVQVKGADKVDSQVDTTSGKLSSLDAQTADPSVSITNNAIVVVQLAYIQAQLAILAKTAVAPRVTLPDFGTVVGQIAYIMGLLVALGRAHADPGITVRGWGESVGQITAVAVALANLNRMSAAPSVHVDGVNDAINSVNTLARAIAGLSSKTITVTTNNVTTNTGGMTGALITQPMTMNVGELGLREALVPLDLPLAQVDPSVRGMAAMLRGESGTPGTTIQRQVNVYNTIEVISSSADPVAIATSVVNRAAAMAN